MQDKQAIKMCCEVPNFVEFNAMGTKKQKQEF
jgi:hypothetical protein